MLRKPQRFQSIVFGLKGAMPSGCRGPDLVCLCSHFPCINSRLGENSLLIAECSSLRGQSLSLARDISHLRQVMKDHDEKKHRKAPQSHKMAQHHVSPTHGESHFALGPSLALQAADLPLESSGSQGFPRRKFDREPKPPTWRPTQKRLYRGSTRALNLLSDRDARIVQVSHLSLHFVTQKP